MAYAREPPPFKDPLSGAIKYYLNFAFCEKTRYVGVQSNYHPRGDGLFLLVLEGTLIKVPKVTKVKELRDFL